MCFTTWKLQSAGSRLGQGGCYGDLCAASFLILNNITFPLFARKKITGKIHEVCDERLLHIDCLQLGETARCFVQWFL